MVDHTDPLAVGRASQHNRYQRLAGRPSVSVVQNRYGDGMAYHFCSFRGRRIDVSEAGAGAVNASLDATFGLIAFEELWDAVVQNFADLERDLLVRGIDDMLFGDRGWDYYQDLRTLFGRRLSNMLSSCRAYIDLAPRELRRVEGGDDLPEEFKRLKSAAYDAHFSYRLMEALRNYTQHYGSPVTSTHMDARRIQQPAGDQFRYVTAASMDAATLCADPRLKGALRKELAGMGKLEVNKFAREYIEQLAKVHLSVRAMTIARFDTDKARIADAIDRVNAASGDSDFGAYMVRREGDQEQSRRALMIEPFDRLHTLRHRNGSLQNLALRYVSGELLGQHLR